MRSVGSGHATARGEAGLVVHQCGRKIGAGEIEDIKAVVAVCSGLSRTELARTLCEHLSWFTASGRHKRQACTKLIEKLEAQGVLRLPPKRETGARRPVAPPGVTSRSAPLAEICADLTTLAPVRLDVVSGESRAELWNEYVHRYHPLGYKKPIGLFARYFVVSGDDLLGCILVAGAAKSIGERDRWIGWNEQQRLRNLSWVANNTRFLILPWVRVKHLASHVLGKLVRRLRRDWYERWGYRPVLMETFVDPAHHQGTCYRAAGWYRVGRTTGEGLRRPGRQYATTPKLIYVRPLVRGWRDQLCSDTLSEGSRE